MSRLRKIVEKAIDDYNMTEVIGELTVYAESYEADDFNARRLKNALVQALIAAEAAASEFEKLPVPDDDDDEEDDDDDDDDEDDGDEGDDK